MSKGLKIANTAKIALIAASCSSQPKAEENPLNEHLRSDLSSIKADIKEEKSSYLATV